MKLGRMIDAQVLHIWAPLAVLITLVCGLMYGSLQQAIRLMANDPQIQIATDISAALSVGEDPSPLIPPRSIDISLSLSPFVILYDENGLPVRSNVVAEETPVPPKGVFAFTRNNTDNRITWEPKQGTRVAAVLQYYQSDSGSGFVLVGRNLREVEKHSARILTVVVAGWIATLLATLGILLVITPWSKRKANS